MWQPISTVPSKRLGWFALLEPPRFFHGMMVTSAKPCVGSWRRGAWRDPLKGHVLHPTHFIVLPPLPEVVP